VPSTKGMMDTENIISRKYRLQRARNTTARLASCIVIWLASLSQSSIISFAQIVKFISLIKSDAWFMQVQVKSTSLGLLDMVDDPRSSPELFEANGATRRRNFEPNGIFDPMGLELMQGQRLHRLKSLVTSTAENKSI
jgi:hypothetical protein